jgi:energy-coupling factor transporter ATP-binding protein EcfA2
MKNLQQQTDLYQSNINRFIESVVQADSEAYLQQEVEEYVITHEIEKYLSIFFQEYIKPDFSESVWISGYFGSGKSHLLKMISYIIENKTFDNKSCIDLLKTKVEADFELQRNIELAGSIPAKSILFNIDQRAAAITNRDKNDAILSVFLRVFNESLGYFGRDYYVAEIERNLEERKLLNAFKNHYCETNDGKTWEEGRDGIFFFRDGFAKAYSLTCGISEDEAVKVLDRKEDFELSIEDFAKKVKAYLDIQPKGFRLVFCADEVGQFIADNTKLMLNLQTLAETLKSVCEGRAFIIVTSQNDMDSVIGDMNAKQANDFSKIQARFAIKIPLTSQNADEVIKKRLLKKNESGEAVLKLIFEAQKNNTRTIFGFTNDSRQFKDFSGESDFVNTYPFVPYQFDLFQSSIKGLSDHNAFQGRHQSVGARSMLGVFQTAAKDLAKKDLGAIAGFAGFFEGIRSSLRSEVQSSILQAENNLPKILPDKTQHEITIHVLKALFLVKYVKEFKANIQNIAILLVNSFEQDLAALRNSVTEALNFLEHQTYIQITGDNYEFLTNVEKDVQNEIKNIDIDPADPAKLLYELLFVEILKDSKVRLDGTSQFYEFGRKLDRGQYGRDQDFYVHFITPMFEDYIAKSDLAWMSASTTDLVVDLKLVNSRLFEELKMYKQTEKFIMQTI